MITHVVHAIGTTFRVLAPACPPSVLAEIAEDWARIEEDYSPVQPGESAAIGRGAPDRPAHGGPAGEVEPCGYLRGWAIGRGAGSLHAAGVRDFCIEGGGDIQARGRCPRRGKWRFGIAHPRRANRLVAVVESPDDGPFAVATSTTASTTGAGGHGLAASRAATEATLAITVVGRDIAEVEAFATAARAAGGGAREVIESASDLDALGFTADGAWCTPGFPRFTPVPPALPNYVR